MHLNLPRGKRQEARGKRQEARGKRYYYGDATNKDEKIFSLRPGLRPFFGLTDPYHHLIGLLESFLVVPVVQPIIDGPQP